MVGVLWLMPLLKRRETEIRLALRVTVAAALSFLLARLLGLAQGYWVVITAVIVMQASLGGSLKAAGDRMAGTLAGAVWGAVVSVLIAHHTLSGATAAIVAAVGPTALLAALRANFRVAPITALIVLIPSGAAALPESPALYALERIAEIALGNVVGILVAVLILPSRAHGVLASAAARVVDLNADLLAELVEGLTPGQGRPGLPAIHAAIRGALRQADTAGEEAARERRGHLTQRPDPEPLLRTLYRVRHDLVMIGRATSKPLPAETEAAMMPPIAALRDSAVALLRGIASALRAGAASPPVDPLEASLKGLVARMDELRGAGRTRSLASEDVGRLYTLRFALEQLALDLRDLAARADEQAPAQAGRP